MGITKSAMFTEKQNSMAVMLKALAHPTRIAILEHLVNAKTCICGELVGELGLAQATISQHLKELKTAGLIKGTVEGTSICYCIDEKVWKQYKRLMQNFFVAYDNRNNCC